MTHQEWPDDEASLLFDEEHAAPDLSPGLAAGSAQAASWWGRVGRGALYGAAFAIPLLLLTLLLALGSRGSERAEDRPASAPATLGQPAPTMVGAWPEDVTFVAHTLPAIVHDELTAAIPRRGYLFFGVQGENWTLAVEPLPGSTLVPRLMLYGPTGDLLATGAALTAVLPETGAYRLVVEAPPDGVPAGAYRLSVFPR